MLQQTQVDRVIPYFKAWKKQYPTVASLARAPLRDVLVLWQGLGYARRAKMLHEASKVIMERHKGRLPRSVQELQALPGVGSYTARAIAAFAYNQDVMLVETNIRTAIIHHFYAEDDQISDVAVEGVLQRMLPEGSARDWYAALMDYGSHLKRSGVRLNAKSKGYTRQKAFKGSLRELRGGVLRMLVDGALSKQKLMGGVSTVQKEEMRKVLASLEQEGFIERRGSHFALAS